jgi:acyl dehydratase
MSYDDYVGRTYGPVTYSTARALCDRYIVAAGDDPARWSNSAPSALAGAMLFAIAPLLLGDPDLAEISTSVIHGEQTFRWERPIPLDAELQLEGEITRLRERGGVFFVGFDVRVTEGSDDVLTGSSLFLMSGGAAASGDSAEEPEPVAIEGSNLKVPEPLAEPKVDQQIATLERCASRSDLVRYAGASQDFNPIHWDHDAAVGAGLPGVVVHGLLQSAWLCQAVERHGAQLGQARFRYRSPLRPGVGVRVEGTRTAGGWQARLADADDIEYVVATFGDRPV